MDQVGCLGSERAIFDRNGQKGMPTRPSSLQKVHYWVLLFLSANIH